MKVAVIGGGISGLAAAWLLSNAGHTCTIYEALPELGMKAHAHTVSLESGEEVTVDVPFRVFNERHYVQFARLLNELGVDWELCNYAATYCDMDSDDLFFKYSNWLVGEFSLPWVSPADLARCSKTRDVVYDFLFRWMWSARRDLLSGALEGVTMGEYLDQQGYSETFADRMFFPIMSTIMTCDMASMRDYPADMVVSAFTCGRGRGVKRALGGTNEIVARLTAQVTSVQCSTPVEKVVPASEAGPALVTLCNGESLTFDHVIVATEAKHVPSLVAELPESLEAALCKWGTEHSDVVVHTDASLMPGNPSHWSPINIIQSPNCDRPMASMWLNRLHPALADHHTQVFQTWNPLAEPDPQTVITRSTFSRPVMSPDAGEAATLLDKVQGTGNVWFAGSYAMYGLPLLENGVQSAVAVMRKLGVAVPWLDAEGDLLPDPNARVSLWGARLLVSLGVCLAFGVSIARHPSSTPQ